MSEASAVPVSRILMPDAGALVAGPRGALWLSADGEVEALSVAEAGARARAAAPRVSHGPSRARRLGVKRFPAYDLLELFAFARPARFCLPTVRGLAGALGRELPRGLEAEAL